MDIMQETIEIHRCIRNNPWLIRMVKSRQFHKPCDQHTSKKLSCYFCCDCMVTPLCPTCFKNSDHIFHNFIQTYISSQQTAVRKDNITRYMDISGIHLYSINSKPIVYINQRRDKEDSRPRKNVLRKCQVCEWEIDAASSALFCSIECKLRNILGSQLDDLMEINSDNSEITENSEEVEPVKKKRHRRKGIPCRAPPYNN